MIENIKASFEDAQGALAGLLANEATLLVEMVERYFHPESYDSEV